MNISCRNIIGVNQCPPNQFRSALPHQRINCARHPCVVNHHEGDNHGALALVWMVKLNVDHEVLDSTIRFYLSHVHNQLIVHLLNVVMHDIMPAEIDVMLIVFGRAGMDGRSWSTSMVSMLSSTIVCVHVYVVVPSLTQVNGVWFSGVSPRGKQNGISA